MGSGPREMIRRLLVALGLKTQAQLSASLGIKPQSIISAVKRGEIPDAWLYRTAYATGRSVGWLRTGRGPAWQDKVVSEPPPPPYSTGSGGSEALDDLVEIWKDLDDKERATVRRCAEALRFGAEDIRDHVIGEMKLIQEAVRRRRSGKKRRRCAAP